MLEKQTAISEEKKGFGQFLRKSLSVTSDKRVKDITFDEKVDLTDPEAHEKLKESNKEVMLATNTQRFFSGSVNMVGSALFTGAILGVVTISGSWVVAALAIAAGGAVMLGGHLINQNASGEMNDNNHDVGDFYNRRQAKYFAQEMSKMLDEREERAQEGVGTKWRDYVTERTPALGNGHTVH